jgi:hypothetical protein
MNLVWMCTSHNVTSHTPPINRESVGGHHRYLSVSTTTLVGLLVLFTVTGALFEADIIEAHLPSDTLAGPTGRLVEALCDTPLTSLEADRQEAPIS